MPSLVGCDFSSRPGPRKPIVIADGALVGESVVVAGLRRIESLQGYADWLREPLDWVGAFDFPFGLPRELVEQLEWPLDWLACMRHYGALSRSEIREQFAAFCGARPAGSKFAHRATDRPAGSSPSMKWVNPPVAYMLHAGVSPLIDAGVCLPGLYVGASRAVGVSAPAGRVALEAYPGLLAREVLGHVSYKSDDRDKQTRERFAARQTLVQALELGETRLGLQLEIDRAMRQQLLDVATGDTLDAVLCLMQAAWGSSRGWPMFGLPGNLDPLEGWILTADAAALAEPTSGSPFLRASPPVG
ncbi:MAG: DUF429 domain-containing protein [Rhodoferax sp.]|nr:DUF429 domain-containing protein [Rhodoferax sp.]